MSEAGIGRVLVASLHQGIADVLPARLEFYENWLHPKGLRDGRIGLAPVGAVLSFLRLEGEVYDTVMARAGSYSADWTFDGLPVVQRALVTTLPTPLRARFVLRVVRQLVRQTYGSSRAIVRLRRGVATVDVRGSIFCGVREPVGHPLCEFYRVAIGRLFERAGLEGHVRVDQCRGAGGGACLIRVDVRRAGNEIAPVAA